MGATSMSIQQPSRVQVMTEGFLDDTRKRFWHISDGVCVSTVSIEEDENLPYLATAQKCVLPPKTTEIHMARFSTFEQAEHWAIEKYMELHF